MKRQERLERILAELNIHGIVFVAEQAEWLGVSSVSIRKDLKLLEEQGKLLRVPGGAVLCCRNEEEEDSEIKESCNLDLKHIVAKKAAELFIHSGDTIFVSSGVTPYLTIKYAKSCSELKILTDSVLVAEKMCHCPNCQVILFGGEIDKEGIYISGRDTVRQAGRYTMDKVILTVDGVHPEAGLSTLHPECVDTLKIVLEKARQRIIVADSTKIGVESFCNVGKIFLADILVTNYPEKVEQQLLLKQISETGVIVVYAE